MNLVDSPHAEALNNLAGIFRSGQTELMSHIDKDLAGELEQRFKK